MRLTLRESRAGSGREVNNPLIGSITFGNAKNDDIELSELVHAKFELYRALERIRALELAGNKMLDVLMDVNFCTADFEKEVDEATEAWYKAMEE